METIKGYIKEISYASPNTAYRVCRFQTDEKEETIVGSMATVDEGEMLELTGEWTVHPVYGKQFKVVSYVEIEPEDETAIVRYLGSGLIKGVGPTLAQRIVDEFGKDTFEVIEKHPERLSGIKGITMRKAQEIGVLLHEKKGYRDAMLFLQKYGIGNNLAIKIYSFYQDRIYRVIEENPYKIAEDISGVGFKTADEIARRAGVKPDSDYRIRSGILYTLSLAVGQGHMYLPKDILVENVRRIIEVREDAILPHIENLIMDRKLTMKKPETLEEQPKIYATTSYMAEKSVAAMLRNVSEEFHLEFSEDVDLALSNEIDLITRKNNLVLDELQKLAVFRSIKSGASIITGGPGTGKTTTINTLIHYFENRAFDIALAAPTGRAAKRMTEATGYEAKTIHRLLELNGAPEEDANEAYFVRNEDNPVEADVIIVDEMSMVDIFLFRSLLKAVAPGARLIMVGDADQLPSVGPGQVLKDLIESECFPVTRLEKIFRQEGSGDIVLNAHRINRGEEITADNKSRDFFFLERNNSERILANMVELITQMLPGYVDAKPFDIQVLTPTRKGNLGVEAINKYLQEKLNPPENGKKEYLYRETVFRVGDKVMQIKNNYKAEWEIVGKYNIPIDAGVGVFNGDMGRIKDIAEAFNTLTVEFDDGRRIDYSFSDLDELELAYAITVHKSQGSEYSAVVMPIMAGPRQLMNRNLLYTGVTRAKKCLVMLGDKGTVAEMIANNFENRRYSGLKDRIIEVFAE
ncbi:MAG: ATP-dependent RecD-like DNA helicase [Lachnospiraceae bacterium]|nr:ATP-dependent RecD-like DNA helicase [Lachnospiraceae bacterium]